jgi:hypothetical protein
MKKFSSLVALALFHMFNSYMEIVAACYGLDMV